tara:strand:- start:6107 stop:6283 length:177 start_codon:yes stop_codon:yes gene_type:complete
MEKVYALNALLVFCLLLLLSPLFWGFFSSLWAYSLYLFFLWVIMIAFLYKWSKRLEEK